LGEYRTTELSAATAALGVGDFRLLGGAGRFRDSGMTGTGGNDAPRAFWRADVDDAAALLVPIVREVRPQVLVTYNEFGGYGHPDHIQAHRVAMRAAELAADPHFPADGAGEPHEIARIYWNTLPRSVVEAGIKAVRAASDETGFTAAESVDELPFTAQDSTVDAVVHGEAYVDRKIAAMRAHATQIIVREPFFGLSNKIGMPISGVEYYQLAKGDAGPDRPQDDLFAEAGAVSGE
ncbi:MAG: N-acetyl-1-D-myo-inositol-2-amino-2-deoxy-alpha-D-glucopyranoside deacetylase, partial [Actinocrinis sp.]